MKHTSLVSAKIMLVLGANGAVAVLLIRAIKKFFPEPLIIIGIDLLPCKFENLYDDFIVTDVTQDQQYNLWQDLIKESDFILIALPEKPCIHTMPILLANCVNTPLIMETLSVKTNFWQLLQNNEVNAEIIGFNPLFRPSLGCFGQTIVYVTYQSGIKANDIFNCLKAAQAKLQPLTIEAHEEKMALVQSATHAIVLLYGMLLKKFDYKLEESNFIGTPVHRHMLQLLARIVGGEAEVYREIQVGNPKSELIRDSLVDLNIELNQLVNNERGFLKLFSDLKLMLGTGHGIFSNEFELIHTKLVKHSSNEDNSVDELQMVRNDIDFIDNELAILLAKRFRLCYRAIQYKKQHNMPMMQPDRVAVVKEKFIKNSALEGVPVNFAKQMIDLIIDASCAYENQALEKLLKNNP